MTERTFSWRTFWLLAALIMTVILAVSLSADRSYAAEVIDSGHNDQVEWMLDSDGMLTISGQGAISSSDYNNHRDAVRKVVVGEGITGLKNFAFSSFSNLTEVRLADSVKTIGDYGFAYSDKLQCVRVGNGLISIGTRAFYGCSSLTEILLPYGLTTIGGHAFCECSSLESIAIPESVTEIGTKAFSGLLSGSSTIVYVIPGSYAEYNCDGAKEIRYLCDPIQGSESHCLEFLYDQIAIVTGSGFSLTDYLVTDQSLSDCDVTLSNEESFMYSGGQILNSAAGTCDVTVTWEERSAQMTVVAQDDALPSVSGISFKSSAQTLLKGQTAAAALRLEPENAKADGILWQSSDPEVATVENGRITAVGPGTAVITALSSEDGSIKAECTVTVPVSDLIVLKTVFLIEKDDTERIVTYKYPGNAANNITYRSLDESVAAVDSTGMITGVGFGSTQIEVKCGDITKTADVTVWRPLKGIRLDQESVTVRENSTLQLQVIYEPEDTSEREVIWSSEDESVATVDQNGLVTTKARGVTNIIATAGEHTASCKVTSLNIPMTGIWLPESVELTYGQEYTAEVTYVPATTNDDRTVVWQSSDEDVLTVSEEGLVTTKKVGTASITATVGEFSASTEVTINKADPEFDVPEDLSATCNQSLYEIQLPQGFSWTDDSQNVGAAGTKQFTLSFTPADTENYNTIEEIPVSVEVSHAFVQKWKEGDESVTWYECACGEKDDRGNHDFGEWNVTKEPTCTTSGSREHVCLICGEKETEAMGMKEHAYGSWRVSVFPTPIQDGERSRECAECGDKETVAYNAVISGQSSDFYVKHLTSTGIDSKNYRLDWEKNEEADGYYLVVDSAYGGIRIDDPDTVSYTKKPDGWGERAYVIPYRQESDAVVYGTYRIAVLAQPIDLNRTSFFEDNTTPDLTEIRRISPDRICEPIAMEYTVTASGTGSGIERIWTGIEKMMIEGDGSETAEMSYSFVWHSRHPSDLDGAFVNLSHQDLDIDPERINSPGVYRNSIVTVVDQAGNEAYWYLENNRLDYASEFDFDFEGALSNGNVPAELEGMEEGKSVLLHVDQESNGILKKEYLDAIKGEDKTIVVYANNNNTLQWVFNGKDITGETKDLDLNVSVSAVDGSVYGTTGKILLLKFADNGELPGIVNFRIKSAYMQAMYNLNSSLYLYYSDEENIVSKEDSYCSYRSDGWCYVDLVHNSRFLISGGQLQNLISTKTVTLSKSAYTYDGKVHTPKLTVKNKSILLKEGTDYTASIPSNTKQCGKYKVTIEGKGRYTGTKTLYYTIVPKGTSISKLKPAKRGFAVKWKKQKTQTSGYQIQYSLKKNFKGAKTVTVKTTKKDSIKIGKLKAKKKYYVKIRTYKTVKGQKIGSAWSKVRTVKTQ